MITKKIPKAKHKHQAGFTLVEIVAVCAILFLVATIVLQVDDVTGNRMQANAIFLTELQIEHHKKNGEYSTELNLDSAKSDFTKHRAEALKEETGLQFRFEACPEQSIEQCVKIITSLEYTDRENVNCIRPNERMDYNCKKTLETEKDA